MLSHPNLHHITHTRVRTTTATKVNAMIGRHDTDARRANDIGGDGFASLAGPTPLEFDTSVALAEGLTEIEFDDGVELFVELPEYADGNDSVGDCVGLPGKDFHCVAVSDA